MFVCLACFDQMVGQDSHVSIVDNRILQQDAKARYTEEAALDLVTGLADECGAQLDKMILSDDGGYIIIVVVRSQMTIFTILK
jgi:hypothetical protein